MDASPARTVPAPPRAECTPAYAASPAAIVALAAIVAVGTWLRLRAIPGPWGSDALHYAEHAVADAFTTDDPRSQRVAFIALVRASLRLGGGTPAAASYAGVLLSAAVGPVLWAALRRRAGDVLAILPAALWAVLGLDIEEVTEISADAAIALPGAVLALTLCAAAARPGQGSRWALAGGLAVGAGIVLKETFLLPAAGFVVAAFVIGGSGGGAQRLRLAGSAVAGIAGVLVAAAIAGWLQRPGVIEHGMSFAPEPVRWGDPAFLQRVTVGVPRMLLTATGAFGLLHIAALPLIVRLPFRAARGDALAVAALVSLVAFDLAPVSPVSPASPDGWAVLTAHFPRFVLPILPLWFAALTTTLGDAPTGRFERGVSIGAGVLALAFVNRSPATWFLVPAGAALCAWPCLSAVGASPRVVRTSAIVLVAAAAASLLTPNARVAPDATWGAWDILPASGAIHADRVVARRIAFAARTAPRADATRVHVIDDPPPPDALVAGDLVLVRRGTRLAAACAARGDLVPWTADLGETLVLVRR